jgi:hypothetical protein
MNLTHNPTLNQLSQLLGSVDDTQNSHILYVAKTGEVHLTAFRADTFAGAYYANEDTVQFVLDTFLIGQGYTGQKATEDPEWLAEVSRA